MELRWLTKGKNMLKNMYVLFWNMLCKNYFQKSKELRLWDIRGTLVCQGSGNNPCDYCSQFSYLCILVSSIIFKCTGTIRSDTKDHKTCNAYRPLSLGGHIENKRLYFCMASHALNSNLGKASRAKTKLFILAKWERSIVKKQYSGILN